MLLFYLREYSLGMFVLDGMNLALLGQPSSKRKPRRDGDLRKVLAVARHVMWCSEAFVCYFDRSAPYALANHDRDIFDLILDHKKLFQLVPSGKQADEMILMTAEKHHGTVISHDKFKNKSKHRWRDQYPFLSDQDRLISAVLHEGSLALGSLGPVEFQEETVFDIYDDLLSLINSESSK